MICKKGVNRFNVPGMALTLAGISIAMVSTASFAGAEGLTGFGSAILDIGNGSVVVSGNGTTDGCIIWYNGGSPPTTCPTTGAGNMTVEAGSTAPFTVGDTGTIDNLNFNTALPLVGFMVVDNAPNTPATIDFDLQDIRFNGATAIGGCSGAAATSPGDTCTPANSPFTLTNGLADPATGMVDTVSISFTVDAWGYTGSSGTNYNAATAYIGTFTSQQAVQGSNIQSILATIAGGGSVNASWSATFTPVAPAQVTSDTICQVRYASNLTIADSLISITNTGATGAGAALAVNSVGTSSAVTGAICVNVYAMAPDEQLDACCSCPVTPDGLVSLSVNSGLLANPLFPGTPPTSVVIKLCATVPAAGASGCAGSAANTSAVAAPGLAAWGTSTHAIPGNNTSAVATETAFTPLTVNASEILKLQQTCEIAQNGASSGAGICSGCVPGGGSLGGAASK